MTMKAEAIIFKAPFEVSIGGIEIPELKNREILIETLYTLISPGTELRVLAGKEPNANQFPLIPGYSLVGRVIKKGSQAEIAVDSLVFVSNSDYFQEYSSGWGAHISHVVCDYSNVFLIPQDGSPLDTVFAAVLAVAWHGVQRVRANEADKVLIIGQGLIGQLALQVFKSFNTQVMTAETHAYRINLSKIHGADYCINVDQQDMNKSLKEIWKDGADILVDTTGLASVIKESTQWLRTKSWEGEEDNNPKLLLLGSYTEEVCFDYFSFLFPKEPDIYTSRACNPGDMKKAIQLLSSKQIKVRKLITEIFPYQKAELAYSELDANPGQYMTFAFKWRDEA